MTVQATSKELNVFAVKLSNANTLVKSGVEPVFRKFVTDIFADVVIRSPVDRGAYRADWDLKQFAEADSLVTMKITNNMPYSGVMEVGSPVGKRPWKSAGPKTFEIDGRVWSRKTPEPVAGGAVDSADWKGLLNNISKSLDGVV